MGANAQLKSEVNECFELTSIAFRLAEAPEYINNDIPAYANDIDTYFSKYKNHELIPYLKKLRNENGISYDAAMLAAAHLEIKNGNITIPSGFEISKLNEIDSRWTQPTYKSFVTYLNSFYKKTKFKSFYQNHTDLYKLAMDRMNVLLNDVNMNWFEAYFGYKLGEPLIIISLSNGGNSYGFTCVPGEKIKNGIVIGCGGDSEGLPIFNKNRIFTITHELIHDYSNNLIKSHLNQLDSAAQKIYSYTKTDLEKNAYGSPQVMLNEWFTRLNTIMYIQDNRVENIPVEYIIREDYQKGFIWMERSVQFMNHFYKNRDKFTYISDYMPQIISFMNYSAENFDQILNEYNNRCPYITDIFPAPGSCVTSDTDTIEIYFSEPMSDCSGMNLVDDENILAFPIKEMPSWKDERTFIIPLNKNELIKGKKYGFKVNHRAFESSKYHKMKDIYTYILNICE